MAANTSEQHVDVVVIGGGQAGLTVGYHLQQKGIEFVVLDASERVGDPWRNRWDSLRLFTQARMNGLPGMRYPGTGRDFVGKDEIADYLEHYAREMQLPVHNGTRVTRLSRGDDGGYIVATANVTYRAHQVVVAMADYQKPRVPEFAPDLDPSIVQLHSSQYRNPSQLQDGPVLVVGLGNSGSDIASEVAKTHSTTVAGTPAGAIPFRLEGRFGRTIGTRLVRFAMTRVLSTSTPIGRRARPGMLHHTGPLVRVRPKELDEAGVTRVGRITGVVDGYPTTDDGEPIRVANVIWCTGFRHGFDWIDIDVFDEGVPRHDRGIVAESPGLYFVGLYWLHSVWSETLPGMKIDARYTVDHLARHRSEMAMAG